MIFFDCNISLLPFLWTYHVVQSEYWRWYHLNLPQASIYLKNYIFISHSCQVDLVAMRGSLFEGNFKIFFNFKYPFTFTFFTEVAFFKGAPLSFTTFTWDWSLCIHTRSNLYMAHHYFSPFAAFADLLILSTLTITSITDFFYRHFLCHHFTKKHIFKTYS